jgi:hypothetical protein
MFIFRVLKYQHIKFSIYHSNYNKFVKIEFKQNTTSIINSYEKHVNLRTSGVETGHDF